MPNPKLVEWFRRAVQRWSVRAGREFVWRKGSASNYKRVVAEILLQRTRAETVNTLYPSFFRSFPSWPKLARATLRELRDSLRPLGLWNQRAKSLRRLAIVMEARKGLFPSVREEIDALPNVGQYIANSIELFCHGRPKPLLDVNMVRVLERFFRPRLLVDIRNDPFLQELAQRAVDPEHPEGYNWAVLDLGALICTRSSPRCCECPLRRKCRYFRIHR